MMKVHLVIPCYNEEASLIKLYQELINFGNEDKFKFYILNNGSTDSSADVISSLPVTSGIKFLNLENNKGYGYGVNFGLNQLDKADFIGWFHGDLQFELSNLIEIFEIIKKTTFDEKKIFFKGIRIERSLLSRFFSFFMGISASILLKGKYYEINAQPTIFSYNLLSFITNPPSDFSFDTYVFWLAKKHKYIFLRKKVKFPNREFGNSKWDFGLKSKINFSYKNLKYLLKLNRINK